MTKLRFTKRQIEILKDSINTYYATNLTILNGLKTTVIHTQPKHQEKYITK